MNPRWSRALQQMNQQGARMQTLLNDLLLLAKLEATDYLSDNQPVLVDTLLGAIKNDAQALSGPRNQRITLEATPAFVSKAVSRNCAAPSPTWCSTRSSTPRTKAISASAGGPTNRART